MTRRKYTCPHCSRQIKVVTNRDNYNYLYCPDCDLRYAMDKPTGRFVSEYKPRKITKFKEA